MNIIFCLENGEIVQLIPNTIKCILKKGAKELITGARLSDSKLVAFVNHEEGLFELEQDSIDRASKLLKESHSQLTRFLLAITCENQSRNMALEGTFGKN